MKGTSAVLVALGLSTALLAGCATPLNSAQKSELRGYQGKGLLIEEKNPGAAAALGILPGGGSFYTGNIGPGIANLLFWPLSILWDPISGYDGAQATNYYATKMSADKKQKAEMNALDDQLTLGKVTKEEYVQQKRAIEAKYSPEL